MKWTCEGSVRGSCGIDHRSYEAAEQHCAQDNQSVTAGTRSGSLTRPYSDRRPVPVDAEAKEQAKQLARRAYPREVAKAVSLKRPEFAANDAIASVLTANPALTADEVIEILDEATEQ